MGKGRTQVNAAKDMGFDPATGDVQGVQTIETGLPGLTIEVWEAGPDPTNGNHGLILWEVNYNPPVPVGPEIRTNDDTAASDKKDDKQPVPIGNKATQWPIFPVFPVLP
jgi:hypothetical protein